MSPVEHWCEQCEIKFDTRNQWAAHMTRHDAENFGRESVAPVRALPTPALNSREQLLEDAKQLITGNRNVSYGEPEDNFRNIAGAWNWYLGSKFGIVEELEPHDVALMMDLMKTARLLHDHTNEDSWKDKAGYVGCGWGCVRREQGIRNHPSSRPRESDGPVVMEVPLPNSSSNGRVELNEIE